MKHNRSSYSFANRCMRFIVAYFFAMAPVHGSDQCTPAEKAAQAAVQGMNAISPQMLNSISNMTGIMNGGIASGSKGGELAGKAAQCMAQAQQCAQTCQQQIQQGQQLMQNPATMPKGQMMVQTGQQGLQKCQGEHAPKCQKGMDQANSDKQHQQQAQQAQPSAQPGQQGPQQPSQQAQQPQQEQQEEDDDKKVAAEDCPPGLIKTGTNSSGASICGCASDQVMASNGQEQGSTATNGETYQCIPKDIYAQDDTSARTLNAGDARTTGSVGSDTVVGDEFVNVPKSLLDASSVSGSSSSGAYQWRGLESREVNIAPVQSADGEQATFKNVDVSAAGGSGAKSALSGVMPPPIGDETDPVLMQKYGKQVKKGQKSNFVIQQPTHYMPTLEEAVKDMLTNHEGWSNPNEKVDHIVKLLKQKIDSGDVKQLCKIPGHIRELQLGIDYAKVKAAELNIYFEKRLVPMGGRVGLDVVCHQSLAGH